MDEQNPLKGLAWGIILSIPLWAALLLLFFW